MGPYVIVVGDGAKKPSRLRIRNKGGTADSDGRPLFGGAGRRIIATYEFDGNDTLYSRDAEPYRNLRLQIWLRLRVATFEYDSILPVLGPESEIRDPFRLGAFSVNADHDVSVGVTQEGCVGERNAPEGLNQEIDGFVNSSGARNDQDAGFFVVRRRIMETLIRKKQ